MRYIVLLIILTAYSSVVCAEKDIFGVDVSDHSLAIAAGIGIAADWWTTSKNTECYPWCFETAEELGTYPSKRKINTYFTYKLLTHVGINYLGTKVEVIGKIKNIWNGYQVYISVDASLNNHEILVYYQKHIK